MKAAVIAIGVAIAMAILFGVIYFGNNAKNQITIVKVFSQQERAAKKLQGELQRVKRLTDTQQALKNYAQALQAIDSASCPKDFRLAWFDYVSAVTDLSEKNLTASVVKDLLELGMSAYTKDGKLTEDALRDTNMANRSHKCILRCQRIAIAYGVNFHPQPQN